MSEKVSQSFFRVRIGCYLAAAGVMLGGCVTVKDPTLGVDGGAKGGGASMGTGGLGSGGGASVGTGGEPGTTACAHDSQCAPPTPYCDATSATCVQCLTYVNCAGTGFGYCDPVKLKCVQCTSSSQCRAATPYCSPNGACVECLSNTNCGAGPVACNPVNGSCYDTCDTDADCTADIFRPKCDTTQHVCVECFGYDAGAECTRALPVCGPGGLCVACATDTNCSGSTPHCNPQTWKCTGCLLTSDCPPGETCSNGSCTH